MKLSVVIPAHNEEEALGGVVRGVLGLRPRVEALEVLVVDDGSTDKTARVLERFPEVRVLRHAEALGYGASLKDGIRAATHPWVLMMDGDGSYSLESFGEFVKAAENYDLVVGRRRSIPYPGWTPHKKAARFALNLLVSWAARRFIPDFNSGQRLLRRDWVLGVLDQLSDRFSFSCGMTLLSAFQGLRVVFLPVPYGMRLGESKVHLVRDGLRTLRIILRLTFRHRPAWAVLPWLGLAALCYILCS